MCSQVECVTNCVARSVAMQDLACNGYKTEMEMI